MPRPALTGVPCVVLLCLCVVIPGMTTAGPLDALLGMPSKKEPMPPLTEDQLAELHRLYGPTSTAQAMQERLRRIVEQLKPRMLNPKIAAAIKPYVFESDGINAFACPDGTLVVLSGLMAATDGKDGMLAATVGHELGHIDCQHGRPSGTQILLAIVAAKAGDAAKVITAYFQSQNDQKKEFEADRLGLRYMMTAGYLPDGALRLQKEFTTRFGSGLGVASYFQTHPPGPARIRALQKAVPQYMLDLGSNLAPVWRPRAGVVMAGDLQCKDLDRQLVDKVNGSAQIQAELLPLPGGATTQAALAEAENQGLDLVLWCEPAAPSAPKKPSAGVNLSVYDVPTGLVLLDRLVPRQSAKALTTPETLALALLSNRNWQCGGDPSTAQVPLASSAITSADVSETMAVVRFAHNAAERVACAMDRPKDVKTCLQRVATVSTDGRLQPPTPSVTQTTVQTGGGQGTTAPGAEPEEKPVGASTEQKPTEPSAKQQQETPPSSAVSLGPTYLDRERGAHLLPMRAVLEAFGGTARGGSKPNVVQLALGDKQATVTLGSVRMETATGPAKLPVAPVMVKSTGYAPVEVFLLLGMTVERGADTVYVSVGDRKATLSLAR